METENYEDKHGPRSVNFKFVTFGATAEETTYFKKFVLILWG
jgi:hypothetical protein